MNQASVEDREDMVDLIERNRSQAHHPESRTAQG